MSPSKLTERNTAIRTNEKNKKKYFFKKTRCRCNGKLILLFINFQEFYILLHTYSLDQINNVLPVTKSRQIITF